MVGEEFSRKPYAVAVQEGSPLRDLLNDAILRLLNQRRLETLKERWWTDNPEKKECGDTNDQSDGISTEIVTLLPYRRWCLYRYFRRHLLGLRYVGHRILLL